MASKVFHNSVLIYFTSLLSCGFVPKEYCFSLPGLNCQELWNSYLSYLQTNKLTYNSFMSYWQETKYFCVINKRLTAIALAKISVFPSIGSQSPISHITTQRAKWQKEKMYFYKFTATYYVTYFGPYVPL